MSTKKVYRNPQPEPWPWQYWAFVLLMGVIIATLCLTTSCSPKIIEKVKYEYIYTERVDTTFIKDSVHIKEFIKGDTVRIVEYRDRYKYQYKMLRDTVAVHDTTAIETIKTVEVEKPLSAWRKAQIGAFPWLVAAILALLFWTFRKTIF